MGLEKLSLPKNKVKGVSGRGNGTLVSRYRKKENKNHCKRLDGCVIEKFES